MAELVAFAEHLRVEPHALDQKVNPFVGGELFARSHIPVKIKVRELDRFDREASIHGEAFLSSVNMYSTSAMHHTPPTKTVFLQPGCNARGAAGWTLEEVPF